MPPKTIIEPFRIKMVEPIKMTTEAERARYLKEANYNLFLLDSGKVLIDFLTDSGTSAMSANQWAGMMNGDESYAGARSWHRMKKVIHELTDYPYILPTHQGRAAERILYSYLGGEGKVFISNTHFDTTRANIEFSGAKAIDCPATESRETSSFHPFKGNLDIGKAGKVIEEVGAENIGAVILTVTNNSGGGQPVSMDNARKVRQLCHRHGVRFILDACRIAENSYFIHTRVEGYNDKKYWDIAKEMFSLADGCIMSAKKDAIVNMGGFLAVKEQALAEACTNMLIITEGYTTYGGLSGRDMEAIAQGLEEVFEEDYLHYRIRSTAYLAEKLKDKGVPVLWPAGGHAVYIDARQFYPHIAPEHFPGQALAIELYLKGGIRGCEIGSVMFGKNDDHGRFQPADMELVRLAIPRRVYTQSHVDYVIEVFDELIDNKENTRGYKITKESPYLRHFTAHFAPL